MLSFFFSENRNICQTKLLQKSHASAGCILTRSVISYQIMLKLVHKNNTGSQIDKVVFKV